MDIHSVSCVYFSPTGTTKTIIKNIAEGMQAEHVEMMDCTNRSKRKGDSYHFTNDIVILATPVYYGRVPEEAKQMTEPHLNGAIEQLQMACQERKEPEMYL